MQISMAELFAGIGGWSESAKMAGEVTPIWRSEIHPYKNKVYELRHPGVPNLGDIRNIDSAPYADIFCVSFPCTGISSLGTRKGLEDKNSSLWFEAERIIGCSLPRYITIENSPNLNKRGLARILAGLARFGYDAEWTCLQGTQFGIQQRRKRIYIIAYPRESRQQINPKEGRIFRRIEPPQMDKRSLHPMHIYPGWRERRDIPEPRTFRSAHDLPSLIHRLECVGDAIIPIIGCYILTCIKIHASCSHYFSPPPLPPNSKTAIS